jgi:hypothetical protein
MGQWTSDFLQFYKMYSPNAVNILGNEMLKRYSLFPFLLADLLTCSLPSLPTPVLKLPVGLSQQK